MKYKFGNSVLLGENHQLSVDYKHGRVMQSFGRLFIGGLDKLRKKTVRCLVKCDAHVKSL